MKFVYNVYEQIEELDGANSNAILKKRIWGGQRKILCDIHGSNAYYAVGDANKNITEYLDSTGTIQAHYEYSPFGKITQQSGSGASNFDFRFSSEVLDQETGLVYYNYRYYSPELGRWLSRDPIQELAFQLVQKHFKRSQSYEMPYGMVSNNPIDNWDRLGLKCETKLEAAITATALAGTAMAAMIGACTFAVPDPTPAMKVICAAAVVTVGIAIRQESIAWSAYFQCMNDNYEQPPDDPYAPDPNEGCSPEGKLRSNSGKLACKCCDSSGCHVKYNGTYTDFYKCSNSRWAKVDTAYRCPEKWVPYFTSL